MSRFDVLVAGAGPAGSTAAREIAAAGARVLVVERAAFPRYKACGGGIPVRTERLLPFPIDSVVEDSIHSLRVSYRGEGRFVRTSDGPFVGMVMRDRFDDLLLRQARTAGAEVRAGTQVSAVRTGDGQTVVCDGGFEATADFLIGADGANSVVARSTGLGVGMAECAAWEVEVEAPREQLSSFRGQALIDVGYRPWGYAWVFPKAGLLSIGIVLPRDRAGTLKEQLRRFLRTLGLEHAPATVRRGHKIRFRRDEPIAKERTLLAGDAAGFADEFTQEGIYYAIQSGRLAARNVLRAMDGDGSLVGYERDVEVELMHELRAAATVGRLFYAGLRRAPGPWLAASRLMPGLWSSFFAVQRGESSYQRELRRVPRPIITAASRLVRA